MPHFTREDDIAHPADLMLLRLGHTHLCDPQTIARHRDALESLGYRIETLELAQPGFHALIAAQMKFPEYYGRNLDALTDCLRDLRVPADERGIVFILLNAHKAEPAWVETLAGIFDSVAAEHLLFGTRMLVLFHSNDPRLSLSRNIKWNARVDRPRC